MLALAVQFWGEAAAQDQQRKASEREFEMWQHQMEMAGDETGASIAALALGLPQVNPPQLRRCQARCFCSALIEPPSRQGPKVQFSPSDPSVPWLRPYRGLQ